MIRKIYKFLSSNRNRLLAIQLLKLSGQRYLITRMDTNHLCNLKCRMCYFQSDLEKRKAEMSTELFQTISSKIFKKTLILYLSCYAEPFCSRNIIDFISIAKQMRVPYVGIATNGQLLNDELINGMIQSGLNELVISISGGKKQTYEQIHRGANWEKLWSVIQQIDNLKKRNNSRKPEIVINYILTKNNISEIDNLVPLLTENHIHSIHFRELISNSDFDIDFYVQNKLEKEHSAMLSEIERKLKNRKIQVSHSMQCSIDSYERRINSNRTYPCIHPFYQLFINPEGIVKFCLFDEWKYSLQKESFESIMRKKDVKEYFSSLKYSSTFSCWMSCPFTRELK